MQCSTQQAEQPGACILPQAEAIVARKGQLMAQLAEELSHGLLSLELSGSSELCEADVAAALAGEGSKPTGGASAQHERAARRAGAAAGGRCMGLSSRLQAGPWGCCRQREPLRHSGGALQRAEPCSMRVWLACRSLAPALFDPPAPLSRSLTGGAHATMSSRTS